MSAETDTVAAATAVHATAVEAHAAALAAREQAQGQLELCEAAAAAAASAYTDATEPTPALAKASLAADDALALAHKRLNAASRRLAIAEDDKAAAERARAKAKREARVAELTVAASPQTLHAAIAEPWRRFYDGGKSFTALEDVARAYCASIAASDELRDFGIHVPSLTGWHAALPALERETAAGRALYDHLFHVVAPTTALEFLKLAESMVQRPPGHVEGLAHRARVLRAGAVRTVYELEDVVAKEAAAKHAAEDGERSRPQPLFEPSRRTGEMVLAGDGREQRIK